MLGLTTSICFKLYLLSQGFTPTTSKEEALKINHALVIIPDRTDAPSALTVLVCPDRFPSRRSPGYTLIPSTEDSTRLGHVPRVPVQVTTLVYTSLSRRCIFLHPILIIPPSTRVQTPAPLLSNQVASFGVVALCSNTQVPVSRF